ncbi:hypothetical protein IQ268_20800 [Oculatella sp. LEGE 06141]|uniref:hypothetical protein n=1 Tax=Oculatella sp. LEGE 06141 TaxID=1828648 RepID=UPI0018805552|nr:hypothetical protein [Oculatella sp. LEGE 06141]MBE9181002.1 hypothetical protein [Oculatella sp. LEGE 06141]
MTHAEIETVLQAAFVQCEAAGCPLDAQQKQILLRSTAVLASLDGNGAIAANHDDRSALLNPLDELTPEQRRAFLQFVQAHEAQGASWKVQLLNDWLAGRESGSIQFLRDQYGMQWLDRIQAVHLAQYSDELAMNLKVGDRIEVSNNLWEWVQDDGPCQREWVLCTVVGLSEAPDNMPMVPASYSGYTTCTVRFDNGMEYEIQGVYEWNRYNWRWAERSPD